MWYTGQTLQHKETKALVIANPTIDTAWAWVDSKGNMLFKNEEGKIFEDNPKNYTRITDWSGRSNPGKFDADGLPDASLKQYVGVSDEIRKQKHQEFLEEWYVWLLEELDKREEISCPFADGSRCREAQKYCM